MQVIVVLVLWSGVQASCSVSKVHRPHNRIMLSKYTIVDATAMLQMLKNCMQKFCCMPDDIINIIVDRYLGLIYLSKLNQVRDCRLVRYCDGGASVYDKGDIEVYELEQKLNSYDMFSMYRTSLKGAEEYLASAPCHPLYEHITLLNQNILQSSEPADKDRYMMISVGEAYVLTMRQTGQKNLQYNNQLSGHNNWIGRTFDKDVGDVSCLIEGSPELDATWYHYTALIGNQRGSIMMYDIDMYDICSPPKSRLVHSWKAHSGHPVLRMFETYTDSLMSSSKKALMSLSKKSVKLWHVNRFGGLMGQQPINMMSRTHEREQYYDVAEIARDNFLLITSEGCLLLQTNEQGSNFIGTHIMSKNTMIPRSIVRIADYMICGADSAGQLQRYWMVRSDYLK